MKKHEWPDLLQRYVDEVTKGTNVEYQPRRVLRRFHGTEITVWHGHVHVDDIHGYVDNVRLRFFLNKWRAKQGNPSLVPTSDDIYDIMIEADAEEESESRKPFNVQRMALNIVRNGIQEPVIVFSGGSGPAELWDGNRRFYGTKHIMMDSRFAKSRSRASWIPVHVVTPTGDPDQDELTKHAILTECNFVDKEHIPWPAYVKAEEIHRKFTTKMAPDPRDPSLARAVKGLLADEYGLKGWRVADRWIKMYELATQFKEYHEETHARPAVDVDLRIQEKFEYFDELSKPGVWGTLGIDPDARDEVFQWLWDGKFKAFPDVRMVPKILKDPVAHRLANEDHVDAVKDAISAVIANDPARIKDKGAASQKIEHFADWLDSFKREDFKQLEPASLQHLKEILEDVVKMLDGLLKGASPTPKKLKAKR